MRWIVAHAVAQGHPDSAPSSWTAVYVTDSLNGRTDTTHFTCAACIPASTHARLDVHSSQSGTSAVVSRRALRSRCDSHATARLCRSCSCRIVLPPAPRQLIDCEEAGTQLKAQQEAPPSSDVHDSMHAMAARRAATWQLLGAIPEAAARLTDGFGLRSAVAPPTNLRRPERCRAAPD